VTGSTDPTKGGTPGPEELRVRALEAFVLEFRRIVWRWHMAPEERSLETVCDLLDAGRRFCNRTPPGGGPLRDWDPSFPRGPYADPPEADEEIRPDEELPTGREFPAWFLDARVTFDPRRDITLCAGCGARWPRGKPPGAFRDRVPGSRAEDCRMLCLACAEFAAEAEVQLPDEIPAAAEMRRAAIRACLEKRRAELAVASGLREGKVWEAEKRACALAAAQDAVECAVLIRDLPPVPRETEASTSEER
jgi:hypothetical protein